MRDVATSRGWVFDGRFEDGAESWHCKICQFKAVLPEDFEHYVKKHIHPSLKRIRQATNWIDKDVFSALSPYERSLIADLITRAKTEFLGFRLQSPESLRKYFLAYGAASGGYAVGYALWNYLDQGNATLQQMVRCHKRRQLALRQIYILPSYRRMGIGTKLLQASFRDVKPEEPWAIESPNDSFLGLLVKLGYARVEGHNIVGDKVTFFSEG